MLTRSLPALASLILIASPTALFADQRFTKIEKFDYPLANGGSFRVTNANGRLAISSWDQNTVSITATKTASTQAELDAIQIDIKQQTDSVEVKTIFTSEQPREGGVSYEVKLPRGVDKVIAETANGAISVENVAGDLTIKSRNGAIQATNLKSPFSIETTNGAIQAVCSDLVGDASLQTTNGQISVMLPSSSDVQIKANTAVGRISSNFPATKVSRDVVGESLEAKLAAGKHQLSAKTLNGSIHLETR